MTTINSVNVGLAGSTGTGSFVGSASPTLTGTPVLPATLNIGGTPITGSSAGKAVLSAANVLVQRVTTTIAAANGTSSIPNDNTVPQIVEGTQIASVSITPTNSANILVARLSVGHSNSAATSNIIALYTSTASPNAVAADNFGCTANSKVSQLNYNVVAGGVSAITFTARIGTASGTWYVSSNTNPTTLGGIIPIGSVLEILEYTP